MIKEAIDRIVTLATEAVTPPKIEVFDSRQHQSVKGGAYAAIPQRAVQALVLTTLQSVLDFMSSNKDGLVIENYRLLVASRTVDVVGPLRADGSREVVARATPALKDEVGEKCEQYLDQETLMIWLQTEFEDSPERAALLSMCGNLAAENVRTLADDGVTQEVVVKTGTVRVGTAIVKNPVMLTARRTFPEVKLAPEPFLVRMRGGSDKEMPRVALYPAAGDAWRLDAISKVADFLKKGAPGAAWSVLA